MNQNFIVAEELSLESYSIHYTSGKMGAKEDTSLVHFILPSLLSLGFLLNGEAKSRRLDFPLKYCLFYFI